MQLHSIDVSHSPHETYVSSESAANVLCNYVADFFCICVKCNVTKLAHYIYNRSHCS